MPDAAYYSEKDFLDVAKIDMHVHVNRYPSALAGVARDANVRLVSVATDGVPGYPEVDEQVRAGARNRAASPGTMAYTTGLTLDGWGTSEWADGQIERIAADLDAGAVALKVWKNIGMGARDGDGTLLMLDDRRFDPVFQFMSERATPVIIHSGEPRNCWLPVEQMTVRNDRDYFSAHPEFHLALHPELPGFDQLNRTRDRALERHRKLRVVAAHLASLEWSVALIADFLDRFPNAWVDLAERVSHLQYLSQRDYGAVRSFLIQYQDRVLYGTDLQDLPGTDPERAGTAAADRWRRDWRYFVTEEEFAVPELEVPVKGLLLPRAVVNRIYRRNAEKVFGDVWRSQPAG